MFRTLPIKKRLVLSGVISILAIVTLATISVYSLWQSELELERQIEMTEATHHELTADLKHESMDARVIYGLLKGPGASATKRASIQTALEEDIEVFRSALIALRNMDISPEITALVDQTIPLGEEFIAASQKTLLIGFSGRDQGLEALPEFDRTFQALDEMLHPLGRELKKFAAESALAARAHDMQMLYLLLAVAVVTIALVLHNARKVTLTITRPIERLRTALRDVAEGDFGLKISDRMRADDFGEIAHDIDMISERVLKTLEEQNVLRSESERVITRLGTGLRKLSAGDFSDRISGTFNDDYESLRVDYNETVDKLNELLSQVVQSSNGIQARSGEIHGASQNLSVRTASQAATLEETAAALEQMTNSVNTAAQNTKDVEAAVIEARADVEHSGRVVEGAIEAMNEIEASSSRISQIIGVIDDIAFQTNLLALNAGVEAARAGEVGRGFAVVASEVRGLAQRSSEAANEIKILISTSSKHVQDGVQQVDGAGKALSAVVRQVAHISELVSGISNVSVEQANGINEVNIGVSQLDQVTQQNATMVEDSSSAIQSMNSETLGLNQLVGQFVLRTEHDDFDDELNAETDYVQDDHVDQLASGFSTDETIAETIDDEYILGDDGPMVKTA
ncbi:Aspartate chemoreceptor protein [Phaeobacter sp. CECT 5382]|uniref:methyl-accepting chemotaxis protein n=1 Tax=Phaeobacter sp. CECT 5382 TaxID=1712645 RepID=UPI0006DB200E|nr:methyl-accepting chemotaxis protein [Phaeobacter sp. CECT 5382]CUH88881.1 Aspartate chemoreceptor protein [Phaeobacter sp. CECT 5382]